MRMHLQLPTLAFALVAIFLLAACGGPEEVQPPNRWVDVDKSVETLDARWKTGNPFEIELPTLRGEANKAPIQIYGKVIRQLRMNPPGVWSRDTRLLNYTVVGWVIEVDRVSPGIQAERLIEKVGSKRGRHAGYDIELGPVAQGDLLRLTLRVKREEGIFHAAEQVAVGDMLWFTYDQLPKAEENPFEKGATMPRMWSVGMNARRVGHEIR